MHPLEFRRLIPSRFLRCAGRSVLLLVLLAVVVVPAAPVAAQDGVVAVDADRVAGWREELWSVVEVNGEKVGWARTAWREVEGGLIESLDRTVMRMGRMDTEMVIDERTVFVETADGEPVRIEREVRRGADVRSERYEFGDGVVSAEVTRPGGVSSSEVALPEVRWMTPREAEAFSAARLRAGADRFATVGLAADNGRVRAVRTEFERSGPASFEMNGREIAGVRGRLTTDELPGVPMEAVLDASGRTLRADLGMGAMSVTTRAAPMAEALEAWDGPELMASVFVEPTGRRLLPEGASEFDRDVRPVRAVYLVRGKDGEVPALVETSAQRVAKIDGAPAVRVTVESRRELLERVELDDEQRLAALEASGLIEANDEGIKALTARALAEQAVEEADAFAKAEALRSFVYGYVESKGLGRTFSSAAEVLESRSGDCTEHTTLLVAMLRAAGIPARGVTGLIAVGAPEPAFGYHMWAQAWVGDADDAGRGVWVDLDAAWPERFDATRIAISVSDLGDDEPFGGLAEVFSAMGNLEIRVEGVTRGAGVSR